MEDGLDDSGVLRYVGDGGRWSSMVLMVDGDEEESRDGSLSPETLQLFIFYLDVDLLHTTWTDRNGGIQFVDSRAGRKSDVLYVLLERLEELEEEATRVESLGLLPGGNPLPWR